MSDLFNDDNLDLPENDDSLDLSLDKPSTVKKNKRKWREIEQLNEKKRLRHELDSYELDYYNP